MPSIIAPYWQSAAKFRFIADSGPTFTLQNNPSTYSLSPNSTNAAVEIPAQMGPTYLNGAIEFPPTAIPMEWTEIPESDYLTLANYFHLQPCTMIDMNDRGFWGWLKLGDFQYATGSAQKVGSAKAIFVTALPANGQSSTINTLTAPGTLTASLGSGGSIPINTTLYYRHTFWSCWGESKGGSVLSITTTATNQAVTLTYAAPVSSFYRRMRLYGATSAAGLADGQYASVIGDVWFAFTPQWIDTTGLNGQFNAAPLPTINRSFTGKFAGSVWQNLT